MTGLRVALVHDYLTQYGGAERVLDEFKRTFPKAPVFVSLLDLDKMPAHYRQWDIRTTWLQRLPVLRHRPRAMISLLPAAFESFDFSEFDLVLTSSSGFCHGVLTDPATCKITYCHSPARFIWNFPAYARREKLGLGLQALLRPTVAKLRQWDINSSNRTDYWLAASDLVRQRVAKHYRRPSTVLHPPVDVTRFAVDHDNDGYYLMLMRLVGWKRPDIVVDACNRLGVPLVVAGDGRELDRLKRIAGPSIRFVGRVGDAAMRTLYSRCKAFILPSVEDFGITPLEAMASGKPVIAYAAGGARETVREGTTGAFFEHQTVESLVGVLADFDHRRYRPDAIRRHAEGFDAKRFRRRLRAFVEASYDAYRRDVPVASAQAPGQALTAE